MTQQITVGSSTRAAFLCFVVGMLGACEGLTNPSVAPSGPTATTTALASFDPALVASWIRFREAYGLRSDVDWVFQVARKPDPTNEFEVPLLTAEIDRVAAFNLSVQNLAPALEGYGIGFPDDYAGLFIDQSNVIVQFTDHLDAHRSELASIFGPHAPMEVRPARYTIKDLEAFAGMVESERDWFSTIHAELVLRAGPTATNTVRVRYLGNKDVVEPLILEHFGHPDWLTAEWAGPLPWTGPRGILRGMVVDRDGRPVTAWCIHRSLDPTVSVEDDPLYTDDNGICEFPDTPAVKWELEIGFVDHKGQVVRKSRSVLVPANGIGQVAIVVDR